jgi:aldehyde:ferredoxin oxidoreductase
MEGLKNYELCERLKDKYGEVGILCIGPCGEMLMSASTVASTDPEGGPSRHAARGGLGAVMGARVSKQWL